MDLLLSKYHCVSLSFEVRVAIIKVTANCYHWKALVLVSFRSKVQSGLICWLVCPVLPMCPISILTFHRLSGISLLLSSLKFPNCHLKEHFWRDMTKLVIKPGVTICAPRQVWVPPISMSIKRAKWKVKSRKQNKNKDVFNVAILGIE